MIRVVFALVPALWVVAIAVIALQNARPVSLQLLTLQSVEMPFGLMLAFCSALGMVAAALVLAVLGGNPLAGTRQRRRP